MYIHTYYISINYSVCHLHSCQSVQNLGLAVVSIITGLIVEHYTYTILEIFFLCWLALALLASIVIWLYNIKHKGILNMTPHQREEWAAKM